MRPFVHRLDREFEQAALGQYSLPELHLDIEGFLRRLRRQRSVLLGAGVISIVVGVVWLLLATPLYTADTLVLIDNRRIHAVQDSYDTQSQVPELAGSLIDSQVEIVKSEKLAQGYSCVRSSLSDLEKGLGEGNLFTEASMGPYCSVNNSPEL